MTPLIVVLVVLLLAGLKPMNAAACESAGFRVPGISYFVASTSRGGRTGNELRAQLIMGRTDSAAMPTGAAILVPWAYDKDCKPIPWNVARDGGAWSPPQEAVFYTGLLRPRNQWIDGLPTVDIHVPSGHPEFHGEGFHRFRFTTVTTPPLTPASCSALRRGVPSAFAYASCFPPLVQVVQRQFVVVSSLDQIQ